MIHPSQLSGRNLIIFICTTTTRVFLRRNAWLNDNHINFAQILRSNSPICMVYGALCCNSRSIIISPLPQESLQILHISSNHWIALSTLQCSVTDSIPTVYDSLYRRLSMDTQTLLAQFLALPSETRDSERQLSVSVASVAQQSGTSDCGLFAVAFVTHLAHGLNSCYCNFKQNATRMH